MSSFVVQPNSGAVGQSVTSRTTGERDVYKMFSGLAPQDAAVYAIYVRIPGSDRTELLIACVDYLTPYAYQAATEVVPIEWLIVHEHKPKGG